MSDTEREQVNAVARVLMAEWERVEGPVTASYVANFADMARAVIASDWLAQVRTEERERIAAAIEDRKNAYGRLSEYTDGLRDGLFIAQGIARAGGE